MKTIRTVDGCVATNSILGVGVTEGRNVFRIKLICTDGIHVFAEYPTLEKAERYYRDLVAKINYSQKRSACLRGGKDNVAF